ncbi:aldo/keto reductase [Pelagicoccus mobilis]|uniref:Aldo/keto reductase n=1 Tax=Pelagicoccus mobilis TaxID=415221 RepID=A0A934S3Q7_9BACT|nr:aldo/keto reductase [Pelagicoccus mobilis]MBK1878844.1 aldo/keto reductase [Pelagicoccus mobilis]
MRYRRYGRTELQMPVITCGGMRFQQSWSDEPLESIKQSGQENLEAAVKFALEVGSNHIETARGYGTSEMQLGQVLPKINRDDFIMQTKVAPDPDPKKFLETFEKSMEYLQLDHVDLFSFHGINNAETLDWTVRDGGCLEVVRKLQAQGRIRFVGFSTHGGTQEICDAVATGEFDYVNLHWYFVNELNWEAIQLAHKKDMGVFIISPNDKGGRLYDPPAKLKELCGDLDPMQWNALFCLSRPEVHTLSMGVSCPQDFDTHVKMLDYYDSAEETMTPALNRIRSEMASILGKEWCDGWWKGLPEWWDVPGDINVKEILRLYTYGKSLDIVEWGKMRYNLLGNAAHWFPGQKVSDVDPVALKESLAGSPFADRIPEILDEAHAMFNAAEVKRQSES